MIRAIALLLFGFGLALPLPSLAADLPQQATERAAATVNEEAITIHDLDARVRLGLLAANLPDTNENRQRLAPEVLRRLVDERLEGQEAARLKITLSESEINAGMADLEKQNHMDKGQLEALLESHGIDPQTLRDQLRAQLLWVRVVRETLRPNIRIGEEEIDNRLAEMRQGLNKPAYLLADIYLAVDDPDRDAQVHQLADRLEEQLKAGAPFSALARQFSQSGAATGGDLGWVSPGMIDDTLLAAVSKLEVNQATLPIRTRDGYHILLLRDKHEAGQVLSNEPTIDLAQIDVVMLPSSTAAEQQEALAKFHRAVAKDNTCDGYEKDARAIPTAHFARAGLMRPSEMPIEVRGLVDKLKPGQMSDQFVVDLTHRFFVVCSRTEPVNGLPSREEVRRRIENERLELLAARYLRDLRRAAFVEIRM